MRLTGNLFYFENRIDNQREVTIEQLFQLQELFCILLTSIYKTYPPTLSICHVMKLPLGEMLEHTLMAKLHVHVPITSVLDKPYTWQQTTYHRCVQNPMLFGLKLAVLNCLIVKPRSNAPLIKRDVTTGYIGQWQKSSYQPLYTALAIGFLVI